MANVWTQEKADKTNQGWVGFWENTDTPPWQKADVNGGLSRHYDLLSKGNNNSTIFVPLCGKSVDMLWLLKKGHKVIGSEISELAIQQLFAESAIPSEKIVLDDDFYLVQSADGNLMVFCGDFLKFKLEYLKGCKIDAMWDRGSLIAMEHEQRESYVELIASLLSKDTVTLLEKIDHDDPDGRPFQFTLEELHHYCGKYFDIEELSELADETNIAMSNFMMKYLLLTRK